MGKSYNFDKQSDRRRFQRDMEKKVNAIEKKAIESFKKEMEFSIKEEKSPSLFYQKPTMGFQYKPSSTNSLYNFRKIRCPECFRVIGVKSGINHCAWCNCQIEVTESTKFLE